MPHSSFPDGVRLHIAFQNGHGDTLQIGGFVLYTELHVAVLPKVIIRERLHQMVETILAEMG